MDLWVVAHELRRPEQAVERDVVLPDEVHVTAVVVVPPVAPTLIVALTLGPLLGGRQVADDGVVPDIDALAGTKVVDRELDAPVEIARDRPIEQPLLVDPTPHEVEDVVAPSLLVGEKRADPLREVGVPEVEVLGGRSSGVAPEIFERGSIRSVASRVRPQLSH